MNRYCIVDSKFHTNDYGDQPWLQNWPMLYILENGKQAYIGESNHVTTRMEQHKQNPEKTAFEDVHFIYSRGFNQSVTFDYEAKLIQLFAADSKFQITNRNAGIADKEYYQKAEYDKAFVHLWHKLQKCHLAEKTLEEITNSDLFKYSPYKELNDDQRTAVEEIVEKLKNGSHQAIIVNGRPGSGKTIVAIFLMKYLIDEEDEKALQNPGYEKKKIGLVIPPTSLRKTLRQIFKGIYGLKPGDVIGPSDVKKQKYDILLVDETQRLHQRKNISFMGAFDQTTKALGLPKTGTTELDWILKRTDSAVLFYDKNQVVGPSGLEWNVVMHSLNRNFSKRMLSYYALKTQMRVQGGNDYISYVHDLLYGQPRKKMIFDKPEDTSTLMNGKNKGYTFKLVRHFALFQALMYQLEEKYSLTRMVAGYAWPWISKNNKDLKDITIEGISRMWNCKTEDWVNCHSSIDEVGCIHSIQGFDLNYCFVILGPDIYYDRESKQVCVNPDHYFDMNGKKSANDAELLEYIRHIYYVLMTRGIKGTYLYACDENLREYLSQYVDSIDSQ